MAHSQHTFRAYQAGSSVVLVDETANTGYIFTEKPVRGVFDMTVVKDAAGVISSNIPETWQEVAPSDVMGAIVTNIIVTGDGKDVAVARWLQEQTWDQSGAIG